MHAFFCASHFAQHVSRIRLAPGAFGRWRCLLCPQLCDQFEALLLMAPILCTKSWVIVFIAHCPSEPTLAAKDI